MSEGTGNAGYFETQCINPAPKPSLLRLPACDALAPTPPGPVRLLVFFIKCLLTGW